MLAKLLDGSPRVSRPIFRYYNYLLTWSGPSGAMMASIVYDPSECDTTDV